MLNPADLSRRSFVLGSASALLAAGAAPTPARSATPPASPTKERKKVALLGTVDFKFSHTQHFLDRLLMGYKWDGGWHKPDVDLVSVYIDQFPEGELSRGRSKQFNVPIYPTVAEALTCGTSKLAVDGVLIIGEHGEYPKNEMGQVLYPRYKFFQQTVEVFKNSGRSVPVFNDKHLSTDWKECVQMVETAKSMGFPFLAGSSLPVTWRLPALDLPHNSALKESVCVGYGRPDSYDFHGLETAQCMSERRRGGEVGISSVHSLKGEAMWDHAAKQETTARLMVAALNRSQSLPIVDGYESAPITLDWARKNFSDAYAYFIEHRDGFKTTLFMVPTQDFNYAGIDEAGKITSCQMYLPMPGRASSTADFFNPLIHHVEQMVLTHKVPYPVERTLLTSGMTMAGVESLFRGAKVETPQMEVKYKVGPDSTFWRS